jgi:hypothetical protein
VWSFPYPPPGEFIPFGEGAVYPSEPGAQATGHKPPPLSGGDPGGVRPNKSAKGHGVGATGGLPASALPPPLPRGDEGGLIEDLTILTFANGVHMSLRAAKTHAKNTRSPPVWWTCVG